MPHPDAPEASLDFDRDVVAASRERPVLVDYWAPWCGPCRALGPTLEKLADEVGDTWDLVKINTDEHPALAAQAQIRGIPTVKLFAGGEVVGEFSGALPEPALRRWLDEHLPSPQKERLARATALLEAGDRTAARPLLEEAVTGEPEHAEARALLARALALEDPDRAEALVEGEHTPEAEAIRTLARLLRLPAEPNGLEEAPVRGDYLAAAGALAGGDTDAAFDRLIGVIQRDRSFDDDGARKAAVALFTVLGEGDPVVQKHRPVFNRSLY